MWWVVLIVSAVALAWLIYSGRRDPYEQAESDRPSVLDGATVILRKQRIAIAAPFALHGEPDVVYLTRRGTVILREDKAGFEHAAADRIQLSVYGALLRNCRHPDLKGRVVEPYGFIRYGTPGRTKVRWRRVQLLTDQEIEQLIRRHRALTAGAAPSRTRDLGMCQHRCGHLGRRCRGA